MRLRAPHGHPNLCSGLFDFDNAWMRALSLRTLEDLGTLIIDPLYPPSARVCPLPDAVFDVAYLWDAPRAQISSAAELPYVAMPRPAGAAIPRDPRTNGWELVWVADAPCVAEIPHQAAMAPNALNAVLVAEAEAAGGSATGRPLSLERLHELGWAEGVLDATATRIVAEGTQPTVVGEAWLSGMSRRYIRRRDDTWLYPLGHGQS